MTSRREAADRRPPLVAVLGLAGVLAGVLAGCIPGGGPPGGRADAGAGVTENGVIWRDCSDVPRELAGRGAGGMTYQCATIRVPRDWTATPTGTAPTPTGTAPAGSGTLEIALLRARSVAQSDRIGSLVINPGGPGASGIETAVRLSFGPAHGGLADEVTRRFDIVGFDPRGVGRSSPVDCVDDADLEAYFGADPDPVTDGQFEALAALFRRVALDCLRRYGDGLSVYATGQAARDMDAVRAAVGDEKLTYLGYSYGTLLGAAYARLFPERVRAFVLDGAVDPRADPVAAAQRQAQGFERAFGNFAAWCRRSPAECPVAPDARAALTDALDRARTSPVRGAGGRRATVGWVTWAVISSLYTRSGWEELAEALHRLADGDPAGVFELADRYVQRDPSGRFSTMFDAYVAVGCADKASRVTKARARSLQRQWGARYPLFGAAVATELLACAAWPARADPYPTGAAVGAPPIVVVGTTGDPATPYEQTARLAAMLGVGRVLTWQGEGHTAYPHTPCVTRAVDSYLVDLTVPPEGLRCPAR